MGTQDALSHANIPVATSPPVDLGFNPDHVAVVHKGLIGVAREGTSARVFAGAGYQSAGKTGTAQAVTIGQKDKYNAGKLEESQRDHALYMAFAPAENPKIALAVLVENAGFGAAHAAPIARRVFDYWLLNQYPSEIDMAAVQKGMAPTPIGISRHKSDVRMN
jgi:penicillin-binding protein 2